MAEALVNGTVQLALVGDPADAAFRGLISEAGAVFVPSLAIAGGKPGEAQPSLMHDREPIDGRATAYVCRAFTCDLPTSDPDELGHQLTRGLLKSAAKVEQRHT